MDRDRSCLLTYRWRSETAQNAQRIADRCRAARALDAARHKAKSDVRLISNAVRRKAVEYISVIKTTLAQDGLPSYTRKNLEQELQTATSLVDAYAPPHRKSTHSGGPAARAGPKSTPSGQPAARASTVHGGNTVVFGPHLESRKGKARD